MDFCFGVLLLVGDLWVWVWVGFGCVWVGVSCLVVFVCGGIVLGCLL